MEQLNREKIIETLKEIKAHCESTSRGICSAGGCKFSEEVHGCIFEALGLNQPEDWAIRRREMKKYICDRCGAEVGDYSIYKVYSMSKGKVVDLCLPCNNSLDKVLKKAEIKFFKGGKAND